MQENMSNLMKAGVFPMLRRLHYVSPKGCAEMVAESISHAIDTVKEALPPCLYARKYRSDVPGL